MRQIDIKDAYQVLGLPESASLEEVKNSYKKLAMQFHPDKNSSPDATERFQEIGAAYTRVMKHIENPGYWDDDEELGEEMDLDFFMFMFSRMFARAQARRGGGPPPFMSSGMFAEREQRSRESDEAERAAFFAERKERNLQAQLAAQKKEEERLKKQKEDEIRWEAERAELKKKKKEGRAKARNEQKQTVQETRRASQRKRSDVFNLARNGDAEGVKKGIWEQNVDAAGGECLVGMEDDPIFLESWKDAGYDLKETLLHIFARHGELEMVKWLIDHNAEVEERDSWNRTSFHVALQRGHVPVVSFYIETFPPTLEDSFPIFEPPKNVSKPSREYSLLRLAMDSLSPPTVRLTIANHLYEQSDLSEAWNYITGKGRTGPGKGYGNEWPEHADISKVEKMKKSWASIMDLLKQLGNFEVPLPPPTLPTPVQSPSPTTENLLQPDEIVESSAKKTGPSSEKKKKPKKTKKKVNKVDPSQVPTEPESPRSVPPHDNPDVSRPKEVSSASPVKPTQRPNQLSEIKAKPDIGANPAKIDTQITREAENAYPSPTSGYPSSPEATTRHEPLYHYSHTPQHAHEPSRGRRSPPKYNKRPSANLNNQFTDAGKDTTAPGPNVRSGQYHPTVTTTATAPNNGDTKREAKGDIQNAHTHAETATSNYFSTADTADGTGSSRAGGRNGADERVRGRAIFRGKSRRGRDVNSTHDGVSAAKERAGGGYGKGRGVDANGAAGGSGRRFGYAEGDRGRWSRGQAPRGRGESARGHTAGRGEVADPLAA